MEMSLTMMLSVITLILTFSSLLETTQSRMFRQPRTTNVLLSSGREHDAVYRPSPSPPPPPRSAPPSRPAAQYSLPWPFPLSTASYYVNKLESFIFPPTMIGSNNNWYGRDGPKSSPPPPTANTPGRQIDGDQYVAATGGYRRPASAGPPPPPYPPVIDLTFPRTSVNEPQLDESS